MATGRVWFWRVLIVVALTSAIAGLPAADEHLGSWHTEVEVELSEGNTSLQGDSMLDETAGDQGQEESQAEQSDTADTDESQPESDEATTEDSDSAPAEDSEATTTSSNEADDSQDSETHEEGAFTEESADGKSSYRTEKGIDLETEYQWVIPTTQVVVLSVAAVLAIGLFGTMLTAIVASEAGRVSLMLAVLGPLLAVSQRGEVGTFTRGRIQGYVEANPGIHFSALRDALNLANGVTAHHLHTLEKEGRIISWLDGSKRRYASSGTDPKLLSKLEQPVVGMQQAILEILSEAGTLGIKTGELREKLATSRQLMSYHMKQLSERGFVQVEGRGKARKWSLLEAGQAVLQSSQHL